MMTNSERVRKQMTGAHSRSRHPLPLRGEQGIALFISLMLLALMSVMSLIMVLTVSPDMLINGYYGNFRGSFYAADSGLNIARQQLVNQVTSSTYVSATPCIGWGSGGAAGCTSAPLDYSTGSGGTAGKIIAALLSSSSGGYGGFTSLNSGSYATTSWPGTFQLVNTTICPSTFAPVTDASGNAIPPTVTGTMTCSATAPCPGIVNGTVLNTGYKYQYNYQLCALGRATGSHQVYTSEYGVISLNVAAQTTTSKQTVVSFASFGAFVDHYAPCFGALTPGTMTGPMFTNGAWNFGTSGSYIFTDPVGQANPNMSYWFGSCTQAAACSDKSGGTTIAPSFGGGCNLGQPAVALPANDYSQQWAVLDGIGCGEGGGPACGSGAPPAPTNANLSTYLRDINGNAYPSGGTTTPGVYISYSCSGSCPATGTMSGGGIYVVDNSSTATNITLSVGTDSYNNLTQIYQITQGSTTTTITVPVWNSTTNAAPTGSAAYTKIVSGGKTTVVAGVPMNNVISTSPQPGTMLYVNGAISSLTGTGQGVAAIQDHSQVTIAANGNVNITGDVVYAHEPVTQNVSDTLVAGNDYNQVLGIFTNNGNINLSSSYSNQNLQVDGALAAVGSGCASNSCGFTQSGTAIKTFTNVGGQIQSNIFGANISTENTYFDRRFTSKAGFAPPWFPSTTMPQNDITNAAAPLVTWPAPTRMSWTTTPQ